MGRGLPSMNQHEAEFEKIQIQLNVLPIRMLDTKDTEALSKRRPSDYTLVATTGVTFAEVKGCGNATRFDFSRIRPAQWVYADLITKKQQKYFFWIFNIPENIWYVVPAQVFLNAKRAGEKSIRFEKLQNYRGFYNV